MKKILIANRGEIACRIIRACRKGGFESIAIYSSIEAGALHVEQADEAIQIDCGKPVDSYLNIEAIIAAAKKTGADAIHPGYGFLSENADFAAAVEMAGLTFIGPEAKTISLMGSKAMAREVAREAGVPILAGSKPLQPAETDGVADVAEAIGYPLLVKASGGGGGIGMKIVECREELLEAIEITQTMGLRSFGDGTVFLERYIRNARHIEVQVFGFGNGEAIHLYERECSIQRRFQKIIEESPSPGISADVRARMTAAAVALTRSVRYRGAGTIEFVLDGDSGDFYFLEMNTRIQVEHPVTEAVMGVDLVLMQLQLAAGTLDHRTARQESFMPKGHAIEVRVYAENPEKMFMPWPGKMPVFVVPYDELGVRVETGLRAGDAVTAHFDPMIAKIIGTGTNRDEAISTIDTALAKTDFGNSITNLKFLRGLVKHEAFRKGETFTSFVASHKEELGI